MSFVMKSFFSKISFIVLPTSIVRPIQYRVEDIDKKKYGFQQGFFVQVKLRLSRILMFCALKLSGCVWLPSYIHHSLWCLLLIQISSVAQKSPSVALVMLAIG